MRERFSPLGGAFQTTLSRFQSMLRTGFTSQVSSTMAKLEDVRPIMTNMGKCGSLGVVPLASLGKTHTEHPKRC